MRVAWKLHIVWGYKRLCNIIWEHAGWRLRRYTSIHLNSSGQVALVPLLYKQYKAVCWYVLAWNLVHAFQDAGSGACGLSCCGGTTCRLFVSQFFHTLSLSGCLVCFRKCLPCPHFSKAHACVQICVKILISMLYEISCRFSINSNRLHCNGLEAELNDFIFWRYSTWRIY